MLLGSASSALSQEDKAHWTVLVYMAADNDLEAYAMGDLNEMEVFGSTRQVNIVVQIDRAPGYDTSNDNWEGARRLYMETDSSLSEIQSQQLDDLGEINTGDPAVLADFLTWGIQKYPAEHYAVVFWDHGASWLGVGVDVSSEPKDIITLVELDQALEQVREQTGVEMFDLIGFDACLMSALEVYQTIAPHARYAVASPELAPGFGWDYVGLLDGLTLTPQMPGEAFGRLIVDSFINFYTDTVKSYDTFTMTLVDLARTNAVLDSITQLSVLASGSLLELKLTMGEARQNTRVYGAHDDPQYTDVWAAADARQFMDVLQSRATTQTGLSEAAATAAKNFSDMVIYYRASANMADLGGISLYFPRNRTYYQDGDRAQRYAQQVPESASSWRRLLDAFYSDSPDITAPQLNGTATGRVLPSVPQSPNVAQSAFYAAVQLTAGRSALVTYDRLPPIPPSGASVGVLARPPLAQVAAAFDHQVTVLTDGIVQIPVLVMANRNAEWRGTVNGLYLSQSGDTVPAQLVIDMATGQVISVWAVIESDDVPAISEVMVVAGDQFQPVWLALDADGRLISTPADATVELGANGALETTAGSTLLTFSDQPFTILSLEVRRAIFTLGVAVEGTDGEFEQDTAGALVIDGETVIPEFSPDEDNDGQPDILEDVCAPADVASLCAEFDALGLLEDLLTDEDTGSTEDSGADLNDIIDASVNSDHSVETPPADQGGDNPNSGDTGDGDGG